MVHILKVKKILSSIKSIESSDVFMPVFENFSHIQKTFRKSSHFGVK